jgi:hypothetical protein
VLIDQDRVAVGVHGDEEGRAGLGADRTGAF